MIVFFRQDRRYASVVIVGIDDVMNGSVISEGIEAVIAGNASIERIPLA